MADQSKLTVPNPLTTNPIAALIHAGATPKNIRHMLTKMVTSPANVIRVQIWLLVTAYTSTFYKYYIPARTFCQVFDASSGL